VRLSRYLPLALIAVLAVAGCSDSKKKPLTGTRLSVLDIEKQLAPDPEATTIPVALPKPEQNADWPQPGGDPSHTMQHPALGADLKVAWTADIGDGASRYAALLASPLIADGAVYTMDSKRLVSAFRASDGSQIWQTDITPKDDRDRAWGGGVAYDGGRVYVTTGYAEALALDAKTGAVKWRVPLPTPVHGSPTVAGGRMFLITTDDRLIVLSTTDGHELWRYEGIPEPARLAGSASPAVQGDVVVAPFSSGDIMAFRVDNGRVIWTDNLSVTRRFDALSNLSDIRGRPIIDGDRVFAISHSGLMVSIDLRTGERAWEQDLGGASEPWVAGDFIYVLTSGEQVVCLTRDEGRIRWITQLDTLEDPTDSTSDPVQWTGPLLAGDRLVLVASDKQAWSLSPYTGRPLGKLDIDAGSFVSPIVAGSTLYLLTNDGKLTALR
jgi:outer membrane protein assembly factor BamB